MKLYHYYNKGNEPFLTLTDLSEEEAKISQDKLKEKDNNYDRRDYDGKYLSNRRIVEERIRDAFIERGGKIQRDHPIYFILSESHEKNNQIYREWFPEPEYAAIDCAHLDMNYVSFTYGDSFVVNHPEYHDQTKYQDRVFTYQEILEEIKKHGWPHDFVKPEDPFYIPRYIEAQVWCLPDVLKSNTFKERRDERTNCL